MYSSKTDEIIANAVLYNSADAIVGTDREGVITFWNPGSERIFGFAANVAIGQTLDIIIPENLRARHWAGWWDSINKGTSRYGSGSLLAVPAIKENGSKISVEFTITMLRNDEGRVEGIVAIMRDVSEKFEEVKNLRRELAARSIDKR
ncbi:transcriptional regulator [Cohaesibacter marisflavi]|uniref:Transcriptional regulator n=1 Tax=Cohaesibacter marisflavi TaxID=655353 RepID=A0A1I5MBB8_9HYPH|nr:PAS domain S-box protein [Cohaesibacter marisflavi]SFP06800.1 transcriptional regulator [Cohaesibacter marisflavi]